MSTPKHSGISFEHIPIIDLLHITSDEPKHRGAIVDEIRHACIEVGFFYVKNHRVPEAIIQNTLSASKKFFDLPIESKMELENRKTSNYMGYSPLLSGNNNPENVGDLQEGFELGWEILEEPRGNTDDDAATHKGVMAGKNVWPPAMPGFRETVLQYYYAAVHLGRLLFPLFALALGLPENYFDDKVYKQTTESAALMKLLHYPPQTGQVDDRIIGIGAHTDWEVIHSPENECFTILWQEPGIQALQVLNSDGRWINAPPIPGTFVINLGDQFARWTNDVFKSTVHRAINRSGVRRYSIPLFFGTNYDVKLEPIPSCISTDRPPRYDVITAGEYVKSRLQATYGHGKS